MLKLLQEVRGFAQFAHRSSEPRPDGPLLLPYRGPGRRKGPRQQKRSIKVLMQEAPDIPHPVPITFLGLPPKAR